MKETKTSITLKKLLDEAGFSKEFLWDLTDYSPRLISDAHKNYIEFIGTAQEKIDVLENLYQTMLPLNSNITPADFLERHVYVHPFGTKPTENYIWVEARVKDGKAAYSVIGDLWLADELTTEELLVLYKGTEELATESSLQGKDIEYVRYIPHTVAINGQHRYHTYRTTSRYGAVEIMAG